MIKRPVMSEIFQIMLVDSLVGCLAACLTVAVVSLVIETKKAWLAPKDMFR
jgi:hypothetical protein